MTPEEITTIAQEFWPESFKQGKIKYLHIEADDIGPERWALTDTITGDTAHLFQDQSDKWVEYP